MATRCEGQTAAGLRCKRKPVAGSKFCKDHGEEAARAKAETKSEIIEAVAAMWSKHAAARHCGISHVTLNAWEDEDPGFALAVLEAKKAAVGTVSAAAFRRAVGHTVVEKTKELVDGELVTTKTVEKYVYSDSLAARIVATEELLMRPGFDESMIPKPPDPVETAAAQLFERDEFEQAVGELAAELRAELAPKGD